MSDLRKIVAISEAGGFRRAATQLGIEQSALSRRVRYVEETIGVSLFERHSSGVRPTIAGTRLLREARPILDRVDSLVLAVGANGSAREGALRIGVVASLSSGFARDLLRFWIARRPKVTLEIVEGSPRDHVVALKQRQLDLTFVTGSFKSVDYDIEQLWTERILAALPAGHRAADEVSVLSLDSLADERFIVSSSSPGPEIHDFLVHRLANVSRPRVDLLPVGREPLMTMVGLGLGVSVVSASSTGVIYPSVRFVPLVGEAVAFSAVWAPTNDNPALRRFLSDARLLSKRSSALSRTPDPSP